MDRAKVQVHGLDSAEGTGATARPRRSTSCLRARWCARHEAIERCFCPGAVGVALPAERIVRDRQLEVLGRLGLDTDRTHDNASARESRRTRAWSPRLARRRRGRGAETGRGRMSTLLAGSTGPIGLDSAASRPIRRGAPEGTFGPGGYPYRGQRDPPGRLVVGRGLQYIASAVALPEKQRGQARARRRRREPCDGVRDRGRRHDRWTRPECASRHLVLCQRRRCSK